MALFFLLGFLALMFVGMYLSMGSERIRGGGGSGNQSGFDPGVSWNTYSPGDGHYASAGHSSPDCSAGHSGFGGDCGGGGHA